MSFVNRIAGDLREKRPIAIAAAVLIAALVAVPLLLSKSSSSTPTVAQLPETSQSGAATGVPVVDSGSTPAAGKLSGHERNPFTQQVLAASKGVAASVGGTGTGTSTTSSTGKSTTSSTGTTGSSTGTSTSSGSTSSSTTTTTTTIPTGTPKPAPAGLKATQSYEVKLAITNSSGGLDTIDPLERLSVLPNNQQPLLVELGVLKGGSRVLFAVQPGAVVSGAGACIPGPVDCEILSLPQDQTVTLGKQSSNGTQTVALFAVTGIKAADHSTVGDANKARQAASAAGRTLLSSSTSTALSLFQYEPSVGAVLDLRNLTVGG